MYTRILAAIVLAIVFIGTLATAPSEAATDRDCHKIGITNKFAHVSDDLTMADFSATATFWDYRCTQDGLRLFKSNANTKAEVIELEMLIKRQTNFPVMFCSTGKHEGYILGLWWTFEFTELAPYEKRHYNAWARKYADRRNCRF